MEVRLYPVHKRADGSIKLSLLIKCPGVERYKLPSHHYYVTPDQWSEKKKKVTDPIMINRINTFISRLQELYNKTLISGELCTREYILDALEGKKENNDIKYSFIEMFDWLPTKWKNLKSESTLRKFNQVKLHLLKFNPEISYRDINESFYDDYMGYLVNDAENRTTGEIGLSNNTIVKHFDKIRQVCKEATKLGVKFSIDYEDLKIATERTKPIWMTLDEVDKLKSAEVSQYHNVVRDEWLARYYTSLRSSDLDVLTKNNFIQIDGSMYLSFRIFKTRKDFKIPLHPTAYELFRKYEFKIPRIPMQTKNSVIKDICKVAKIDSLIERVRYIGTKRISNVVPKHDLITTHTARRSFGRRFIESGGTLEELCEIYCHSDTRTTKLYIGWEDHELSSRVNGIRF